MVQRAGQFAPTRPGFYFLIERSEFERRKRFQDASCITFCYGYKDMTNITDVEDRKVMNEFEKWFRKPR